MPKSIKALLTLFVILGSLLSTVHARTFVIATSDSLTKEVASKVMSSTIQLVTQDMALGDKLVVYNATDPHIVTTFTLPEKITKDSVKRRIKLFQSNIGTLKKFLVASSSKTEATGEIFLPKLVTTFGLNYPYEKEDMSLLVIGSPIYHDETNQFSISFSMKGGFIPSDAHLRATKEKTPFAVTDKHLSQVDVHFISTFHNFVNKQQHQQVVHRFWDLYTSESGGALATFTVDFNTGFQRFISGAKRQANFQFNESSDKITMTRIISAQVQRETEEWLGEQAKIASIPANKKTGKIKLGITWNCARCDIDLHARGNVSKKPLYYGRTRTQEGIFNKDFTSKPKIKNGYEFIEFTQPINFSDAQVRVNFYSGKSSGGVRGKVRAWLDGNVYSQDFHIPDSSGNRGRQSLNHWVDINLETLINQAI